MFRTPDQRPLNAFQYDFDLRPHALPGATTLSDVRLAARLAHPIEATTALLTADDPATGNRYTLRLCGGLRLHHGGRDWSSATDTLDESLLAGLEQGDPDLPMDINPWFEWIDDDGVYCSPAFDSVFLDPAEEIAAFADMLGIQAARLAPVSAPSTQPA